MRGSAWAVCTWLAIGDIFFTVGTSVAVAKLPTAVAGRDNTVIIPLDMLDVCADGGGGIGNRIEGIS